MRLRCTTCGSYSSGPDLRTGDEFVCGGCGKKVVLRMFDSTVDDAVAKGLQGTAEEMVKLMAKTMLKKDAPVVPAPTSTVSIVGCALLILLSVAVSATLIGALVKAVWLVWTNFIL